MAGIAGTPLPRRRFLMGGAALGATVVVAGCTGNEPASPAQVATGAADSTFEAKQITMGFSAPAPDRAGSLPSPRTQRHRLSNTRRSRSTPPKVRMT
jgi:hypothetical protein